MSNLFIETNAKKQLAEQVKNQKVKTTNQRVANINSGGYQWGLIEDLKKDVAPTSNTIMDARSAHDEFMRTLETYGVGGSKEIYNAWEMALGDRYNDPYYKRMLTIAIELTLKKYVPYPPKD
tara:strand:- start:32 stop:397 length:366 start_codon:yes stop_codon:yes gene_type:complete